MLMQYLNSNEALKLNDTFKLYLTILSVDHEKFKATTLKRNKKRTPQFYKNKKLHVGASSDSIQLFKRSWALDIPSSYSNHTNIFLNKCLLVCFIIALLQHGYFENERVNKTYVYAQLISSKNSRKQTHAGNILQKKLSDLILACKLSSTGPYDLLDTMQILHKHYKVQFFVFSGVARANKLLLMHPSTYDDSLKPIYLYQMHNRPEHLIFIKNINGFYRAHYRHCFVCKKSFSAINYRHICCKRETCFSCRRFYQQPTTYVNSSLKIEFCDRFLTNESSFLCRICNLTIFSNHCYKAHKKICYGKGSLGWKCLNCNKFYYRYKNKTSDIIKASHYCNEPKHCHFCFKPCEKDHLCCLKKFQLPKYWPLLGFLSVEFIHYSQEEADDHYEPFLCTTYIQNKQNPLQWLHYSFSQVPNLLPNTQTTINLPNFEPQDQNINYNCTKFKKRKDDFKTNLKKLLEKSGDQLKIAILQFLMSTENTTFVCQTQHGNSDLMVNNTKSITSELGFVYRPFGVQSQQHRVFCRNSAQVSTRYKKLLSVSTLGRSNKIRLIVD